MKTFNILAAVLAAASSVLAVPSPSEELAPRQSSLTPVTVKGNGEIKIDLSKGETTYLRRMQRSSQAILDSTFAVSITNQVDHQRLLTQLPIPLP
jgi:hypothetical protein